MTTEQRANVKRWVEALEGGEYRQVAGRLRRDDRFCCLGVACDVYLKQTGQGSWSSDGMFFLDTYNSYDLPTKVRQWYGFLYANPRLPEQAIKLNDIDGLDFTAIAALVRARYLGDS